MVIKCMEKNKILKLVLSDDDVKSLISENKLSEKIILDNLTQLYSFITKKNSLIQQGYVDEVPTLYFDGIQIVVNLQPMYKVSEGNNIVLLGTSLSSSTNKMIVDEDRNEIIAYLKKIYLDLLHNNESKGLCITGKFGVGKSYLMSMFINLISPILNGRKLIFTTFSEMVTKIKKGIQDGNYIKVLDVFKNVDILIIDDFGSDNNSEFIRDDILLPVLQNRMEKHLLTCMTTNLDERLMHEYLEISNKEYDKLKAFRIIERMFSLMEFKELKGQNLRRM